MKTKETKNLEKALDALSKAKREWVSVNVMN